MDELEYYKKTHPDGIVGQTQPQPVVTNPNKTLNKTTPVAEEVNPYADRAAAQAAINQSAQPAPAQPANLFAQQKQAYLASPQAQGKAEIPTMANVASTAATSIQRGTTIPKQPINPDSDTDGVDSILGHFTTPREEEKYRKASVARQRIMAVADALRHIGNIYHTTRYAPSQKFNMPVEAERQRYQQEKALRDQANQRIISYQQAKAKLDADQNRWEAEQAYKHDKDARDFAFNAAKYKADSDYRKEKDKRDFEFNQQKEKRAADQWQKAYEQKEKQHKQDMGVRWYNAKTSRMNAERMANGGGKANSNFPVKTPYGQMEVPGRSIPQAQLNQAYTDFVQNGWIKQGEFEKRMAAFGLNKPDPDYVQNRMVEEVIAANGDASDYMRDNFNWRYVDDSRGNGSILMRDETPSTTNLGYTPAWQGGKSLGTGIGAKEEKKGKSLGTGLYQ